LPNHEAPKFSTKRSGIVRAYAANTNQGIYRDYNEDRVSIILNMGRPENKKHLDFWPKVSYFGVFDGHGGSSCAEYLRDHLHQNIVQDENFPENPKEALRRAFALTEKRFL